MTSAQPPSNGDRPAAGQEAAPQEAGSLPTSEGTAAPGSPTVPAPKRTTARRTPAAKKPEDAENPVKRTPSARKRSTATPPISPNGEAPEILDAMLGKAAAPAAADTSASPAEPVASSQNPDERAPEPPETETAVLPSATDFYREPTGETEVLAPTDTAVADQLADEDAPVPAQTIPLQAADEDVLAPAARADTTSPAAGTSPAAAGGPAEASPPTEGTAAAGPDGETAGRQGRSMNDLADRLDDSRFFSSLFDFTFTSYVTRKLAGPVYVVGLVLIGLGIVVGFANSLGIAIAADSPGGAFIFLLGVLVTLVAAILAVLLLRVTIEVFCAIIEIAQNTRRRRPPRE
ncbi:DUF4282 domain-containing protein [Leifsonia shinshuensis]|uniref:DUF4282 domain-containing protein n=1 Tax=Leifsonia shinshuensis TaxID=150026 RepID=UPI001F50539E|nr:DUF4282 domain-containing protein [Leifsonia shinshuensis]MCI0155470.1 DUF4282 domain-containing protein [Leifsonia shinshuensis]